MEVSVVIPNYNGLAYLEGVLSSLECQSMKNFEVILVDNGSTDGSCAFVASQYSWVHIIELSENFGFSRAVNEGIKAARAPYVLLLNNDTEVEPDFLKEMTEGLHRHKKAFSCQAKMLQFHDREKMDDGGNYYCALGWAFAGGKGKAAKHYDKEKKIFSSCAGAAIYRKKYLKKSDILTMSILHIWKIWMWDTEPAFTVMKTGIFPVQLCIRWEAAQAVPGIISLKSVILPEIIST